MKDFLFYCSFHLQYNSQKIFFSNQTDAISCLTAGAKSDDTSDSGTKRLLEENVFNLFND